MRTLIKAGLRIFSLFVFLNLVSLMSVELVTYYSGGFPLPISWILVIIAVFLLETAVLLFFWLKTDKVVDIVAGGADEKALVLSASSPEITSIILRVAGIYFILRAIPEIAGLTVYQVWNNQDSGFRHAFSASDAQHWLVQVLTLAIGLGLVLGAGRVKKLGEGIANLWKYGGASGDEEKAGTPPLDEPKGQV
jgi:hypothetical protein